MERESSLGGRLRRLMEEEGLSYEQLGERLGMNPQTLNRYVLGQREPKIGTASAISNETIPLFSRRDWIFYISENLRHRPCIPNDY